MRITETISVRSIPQRVFEFFENLEVNFPRCHPDHRLFRWEEAGGVREGVTFHVEATVGGELVKTRLAFTRVERPRRIEIGSADRVARPLRPIIVFDVEPEREGVRLTVEMRTGRMGPWLNRGGPDAVRRHLREELENLKRLVEEPADGPLAATRAAVDPYLARVRDAVEQAADFRLVTCGVLYRGNIDVVFGVECERADGTFRDLRLVFRCGAVLSGEGYRGTLSANVEWHRPAAAGQRERSVYEARAKEIRYTGPPPIDALVEQLPSLEEAMLAALRRGRPAERTFKVYLIESEADWGRRIDEEIEFMSRAEAERYAREYNEAFNRGPVSSTWSIVAKVERDDGYSVLG